MHVSLGLWSFTDLCICMHKSDLERSSLKLNSLGIIVKEATSHRYMQASVVNLLSDSDDRARVGISLPLPETLSSDLNVQEDFGI
jgi:hypothetical protein